MLLRCKEKCKLRDGTTTGSLDLKTNEVVCDHCNETLPNVSPFTKNSMKHSGDILKEEVRKAFVFPCETCNKKVEAKVVEGDRVVGKGCEGDCSIKVPSVMIHNMKLVQEKEEDAE